MRSIVADHALRDTPDEPGAREHRVRFVHIKPWLGAVGYIAKYIAKSVDGHGVELDLLGNPIYQTTAAVDAWASTWRIRQFQQVGGVPVGLWREIRRIAEGVPVDGALKQAVDCVHRTTESRADFAGFVRVMGGAIARRADRPIELVSRERYRPTRYGDRFVNSVVGVRNVGGVEVCTRLRTWRVVPRSLRDLGQCVEAGKAMIEAAAVALDLGLVSITVRKGMEHGGIFQCGGGEPEPIFGGVAGTMRHSRGFGDDGDRLVPS